jgi:hypothetical protein
MTAYKVDIQANVAELERAAKKSVEEHLAAITHYELQNLVGRHIDQYVAQQVELALTLPEVSAVINSTITNKTQAVIDKKIAALRKKLGGTP